MSNHRPLANLSVYDAIRLVRVAAQAPIKSAEAEAVVGVLTAMAKRITAMELDIRAMTAELEALQRENERHV